jgi:hypothetical protein
MFCDRVKAWEYVSIFLYNKRSPALRAGSYLLASAASFAAISGQLAQLRSRGPAGLRDLSKN